ncbi:v-SNARE [Komagataella phaffii CBS 7435]|uniref:V-SNARE n=1 Tax=Komagataella phaffii (strain ATCC 76273 / CBS 7435 / CECT 11047 / NRRL Y-11430 / Wegner 21-1) TaxID=981350 RepID=F2QPQ5_KOMPC|nr:GQ67_01693T0 [Komagataella phaffii]CAH2447138.1 v-SNARE [Komagataella phaffii CBS 7435]CCA37383.1 v-SNARE [Komagataella phaffii CBS 7435]
MDEDYFQQDYQPIENKLRFLKKNIQLSLHTLSSVTEGAPEEFESLRERETEQVLNSLSSFSECIELYVYNLDQEATKNLDRLIFLDVFKEHLSDLRSQLRTAILANQANQKRCFEAHRQIYCQNSYKLAEERQSKVQGQDESKSSVDDTIEDSTPIEVKILNKNQLITDSLGKSREMMQSSVMQSELNLEELDQNSRDLQTLSDRYALFNGIISGTSELMKTINKSSKKEKRDIYMALAVFCAVSAWIVWRRLLRRPVMLVFWMVLKSFNILGFVLRLFGFTSKEIEQTEKLIQETLDVAKDIVTSSSSKPAIVSSITSAFKSSPKSITQSSASSSTKSIIKDSIKTSVKSTVTSHTTITLKESIKTTIGSISSLKAKLPPSSLTTKSLTSSATSSLNKKVIKAINSSLSITSPSATVTTTALEHNEL